MAPACVIMADMGMVLMMVVVPGLVVLGDTLLMPRMVGLVPAPLACVVVMMVVGLPSAEVTSFRMVPAGSGPLVCKSKTSTWMAPSPGWAALYWWPEGLKEGSEDRERRDQALGRCELQSVKRSSLDRDRGSAQSRPVVSQGPRAAPCLSLGPTSAPG